MVRHPGDDPAEDLRTGWALHVAFGLPNPAIYKLMYCDPYPGIKSPAVANSYRILREHIRRIAFAVRLLVNEEHAADLVHASGCGTVLTLLSMPEENRDMGAANIACDAIIAAITTESPVLKAPRPAAAAVALHTVLPKRHVTPNGERTILAERLQRLANE
jgi:hypothetical protein